MWVVQKVTMMTIFLQEGTDSHEPDMAAKVYIIHRSFYPADATIDCWLSNVYSHLAAAYHCAQGVRDDAKEEGATGVYGGDTFPCIITTDSYNCKISIHPVSLPEHARTDFGNLGYVVVWTSQSLRLGATQCPVESDTTSRFTYEATCKHVAALAHRSSELSPRVSCQLMIMHEEQDMPHWYGVKVHNTDFSIDVFDRTLYLNEVEDLTEDPGTIDLVE